MILRNITQRVVRTLSTWRLFVAGIGAVSLVGVSAATWERFARASPACAPSFSVLQSWHSTLRALHSLHVVADARIVIWDAALLHEAGATTGVRPGEEVVGRFETWALGPKYRISSFVDPDRLPGMEVQVAYDGERFQLLLDGTLSTSHAGDRTWALPVLPDPLLQLVQIQHPLSDATADTVLRLKDVQAEEPAVDVSWSQAIWHDAVVDGQAMWTTTLPGPVYEGRAYWFRVYVDEHSGGQVRRIERFDERGILTRTQFDDHRPVQTRAGRATLPHRVDLQLFSPPGTVALSIELTISELQVDAELPHDVFVIEPTLAQRIWDDDAMAFVIR